MGQPNAMQPFAPTFVPSAMPQPTTSGPADPFAKFEQDALNRKQSKQQVEKVDEQNYYDDEYGDDDYYNEDHQQNLDVINQL